MTPRIADVRWLARALAGREPTPADCIRARRLLLRVNAASKGRLLHPSAGVNRKWWFVVARLRALAPDVLGRLADASDRIKAIEEEAAELRATGGQVSRYLASQTREIGRLAHGRAR